MSSIAQLFNETLPPSSLDRLLGLRDCEWIDPFRSATQRLIQTEGLRVAVRKCGDHVPSLVQAGFSYGGDYGAVQDRLSAGEAILATVSLPETDVIGFGIAALLKNEGGSEIELIEVADRYSRRAGRLVAAVTIQDQEFSVGVGHAVVLSLIPHLELPIAVEATNEASKFIFRCFGFRPSLVSGNPNWLELQS